MEIPEKLQRIKTQIDLVHEKSSKSSREALLQNIDYWNSHNYLIVGFLLATFSSIFTQTSLEIISKELQGNSSNLILVIFMILSFVISLCLIIILILEREQIKRTISYHQNIIKSS